MDTTKAGKRGDARRRCVGKLRKVEHRQPEKMPKRTKVNKTDTARGPSRVEGVIKSKEWKVGASNDLENKKRARSKVSMRENEGEVS